MLLKADTDAVIQDEVKRMFDHSAYTHSHLSLIEDPAIVAHAIYLASCQLNGRSPSGWFQALPNEEHENAELLSSYMENIFYYKKTVQLG